TEGDEKGALMTIPFKSEKDAFTFLTAPSQLSPSKATSGSGIGINLSNTGGLFSTATHTTSGQNDTYTFKTAPAPMASPSPGTQQIISGDEIASVFVITFALTVPHVITSAPGALCTLDRKTAIWKLARTTGRRCAALDDILTADNNGVAAADRTVGFFVARGWRMDLADVRYPIEKYETMSRCTREAEQAGFDAVWLYDHFHTVPTPQM